MDLIKKGIKSQTTRIPRKPHKNGSPAYKIGDKVQLYFHSRSKKSCNNCIKDTFENHCGSYDLFGVYPEAETCCEHTNCFGESEIIEIKHYDVGQSYQNGNELWTGCYLGTCFKDEKEMWAQQDGFDSWSAALIYFSKSTEDEFWMFKPLDIIVWDKEPIIKRWTLEKKCQ